MTLPLIPRRAAPFVAFAGLLCLPGCNADVASADSPDIFEVRRGAMRISVNSSGIAQTLLLPSTLLGSTR